MRNRYVAAAALVAGAGALSGAALLQAQQPRAVSDPMVGRYFTEVQAQRGEALFNKNCSYCHTMTARVAPMLGGSLTRVMGRATRGRWMYPTAFYLHKKMENMPANNIDSITAQQRVDILAYILKSNGLQPGDREVPPDPDALRAMPLPAEPGFENLFNGHDFTGFTFTLGRAAGPAPAGCGKTTPDPVFTVVDGTILTTGKIHGLMWTAKKYRNYTIRMEQRFIDPGWDDDVDLHHDQAGWLLFPADDKNWPTSFLEVEGRSSDMMYLHAVGITAKNTTDHAARRRAIRPINQWNEVAWTVKDGTVTSYLNGEQIAVSETGLTGEYPISFQSQGVPVQWRFIRIRVEE